MSSAGAAWARWLGSHFPTQASLEESIQVSRLFSMRTSRELLLLADRDPEREQFYLTEALREDPRNLSALLRLSLHAEFAGDQQASNLYLQQALHTHHSFQTYMAALNQAARRGDPQGIQHYASLALAYCPRDADGVYRQLGELSEAEKVVRVRPDFLRYLIGQNRLAEALAYEQKFRRGDPVDRYRLDLADRLLLSGQYEQAAALFSRLHPEFQQEGRFNVRFEQQPTSLAFDWRLAKHPSVTTQWRPGTLEVELGPHQNPVEVASIFTRELRQGAVSSLWTGDTQGLAWQIASAAPGWQRVGLTVPAGAARRFQLSEVRFR
ncbi:tetratricopeptide repeat protein [Bryobacter aggregatus]|uniref:tetratricopeptide repeat protein n=1 Tax=Bryobacter aggregatus TaxID=360054 RepID=UPI00138E1BE3|nr:hypothetical protein [Bryobacter aggregatus]